MSSVEQSGNWSKLVSLIDLILDTPVERRRALIAELSTEDPARRSALERLLQECEAERGLLTHSAPDLFAALFEDDATPFPAALAGRYESKMQLGRGGMATVYLARDLRHRRDVAVKVVNPRLTSTLGADRFLREIEIVAQLQHPHIVPLFDSGEADGAPYYVMPYEAGLSLRERLDRDGALLPEDVTVILRDVCDALAHAHERGIVHRDIKPDNVLLSGRHAMVADFGVAKAATEATTSLADTVPGIAFGTPTYMAPEQITSGAKVDQRADIYSVGVLGYELLAGRPPFTGETRETVLEAHLEEAPVPLADCRPEVPSALADIIMKALKKSPDDRWQSADEMVARLEGIGAARSGVGSGERRSRIVWSRATLAAALVGVAATAAVLVARSFESGDASWRDRWSGARIERLTDFPGSEVDPAISADGSAVTFLADRDSVFDAFVMRVGGEQFQNLTGGRYPQLFNEDVRNVGFNGDGTRVWLRVADITSPASVRLVPTSGGAVAPFLATAVMAVWSPDATKLAYHETTPGDPIFVADSGGQNPQRIFISDPGVHNHHLTWSPDGRFVYFARGFPPDEMDIWRIPARGGSAERITDHNSRVAYPVLLDSRTLLYTATADDGTGPWLYSTDVEDRVPHRVTEGVEHYISIAASRELPGRGQRLVASVSNPIVRLMTAPITDGSVDESVVAPLGLPTARASAPRFGRDSSLWYLGSRSGADGLWTLKNGQATEIWKASRGAVVGAAAVSPDGRSICFPVRRNRRATLHCMGSDGTAARPIAESLDVRGAPSWSPDGRWIVIAAEQANGPRLFRLAFGGGTPVRLLDSVATNPLWSPDGKFILYSGTPRARSAPLKAISPDGAPFPVPTLVVDRVTDSYRFLPDGKRLVVKQGGFRSQDFWLFDIASGQRRRLTRLNPGESLRRFDVSPDGRRIVFERVRENSDVVLIELPPRR
ncbi:MAG TPA: protein kinase [Gemmatimonadaceae bacterium]|nr:protein kinase [Gemmatimonadaceae bacterium]